jgi:hypothetical protein
MPIRPMGSCATTAPRASSVPRVALWLCSDEAAFAVGHVVDGGQTV